METIRFVLFFVLAISCVVGFATQERFVSRLRKLHHETWEHLGIPGLFSSNNTFRGNFGFFRFMWRREYEALTDASTVRLARFIRAFYLFYLILFGITMFVSLLTILGSKRG